jgi:DNA-binding MltR family transcriptional regulator
VALCRTLIKYPTCWLEKIDIAYAFDLISETEYSALLIIKNIRNKFAHSQEVMGFEKEEIAVLVSRMNCKDKKADTAYRQFFSALVSIGGKLIVSMEKQQKRVLKKQA